MSSNQDTLMRQWHMLRLVPRYPMKITALSVRNSLAGEGFVTTERTVQRDLQELSAVFPLIVDDREKPYGWSWQKDARSFDLPGLTVPEALTWVMAEQHLRQLLPVSMLDHLLPHFKAARERLDHEPKPKRGSAWLDKVRTVPPTQPLIPAEIDEDVQRNVSIALLHEKQIEIDYRKRGAIETATHRVHPLALIQRGGVTYLYVRFADHEDGRSLAMHRITRVYVLEEAVTAPPNFNVDDDVDSGIWGFGLGEKIDIELIFSNGAGDHLLETPLSRNQTSERSDAGLTVRATVADTPQLVWWLLGFGNAVEVVKPNSLALRVKNKSN